MFISSLILLLSLLSVTSFKLINVSGIEAKIIFISIELVMIAQINVMMIIFGANLYAPKPSFFFFQIIKITKLFFGGTSKKHNVIRI